MRSRTRLIAIVASLLVCIAMVGTGFASWVILADKSANGSGNVHAEAVAGEGLAFSVESLERNIYFSGPETQNSTVWLYSDEATNHEQLSTTFVLDITGKVGTIDISFAEEDSWIQSAITSGYIGAPTFSVTAATNTSSNTDVLSAIKASCTGEFGSNNLKISFGDAGAGYTFDEGKVTVTMTFTWGAAFENKNPYEFFNALTKTEKVEDNTNYSDKYQTYYSSYASQTWGEAAASVLGAMYKALGETTGKTMTITFTAHEAK